MELELTPEIMARVKERILAQQAELTMRNFFDPEAAKAMAVFMSDVVGKFLMFNSSRRKLLIKFLIETDEIVVEIMTEAIKAKEKNDPPLP